MGLLLALLGFGLFLAVRSASAAPANPALPPKTDTPKTDTPKTDVPKTDATGDVKCPYGVDVPIDKLDEGLRNAVLGALSSENDPAELEKFAVTMDKLCQAPAAKALRDKAQALKALGVPSGPWTPVAALPGGIDPSTTSFPIPGFDVPDTKEGLVNLSPEMLPEWGDWTPTGAPSPTDIQWWTGPFMPQRDSLFALAQTLTGNGARYVEIIEANPEKPTIGNPEDPIRSGFSFLHLSEGERVRIPKSWNTLLSDAGTPLV